MPRNDSYTNTKEEMGKAFLKQHWKEIFPEAKSIKWVTSKKLQVKGVDFIVTRKDGTCFAVDLKGCYGPDYDMNIDDFNGVPSRADWGKKGAPVELFQHNRGSKLFEFTNVKRKLTDEMLYIISDYSGTGFIRMSYEEIKRISHEHVTSICFNRNEFCGKYKAHLSQNGTGWFVKAPVTLKYLDF